MGIFGIGMIVLIAAIFILAPLFDKMEHGE